MLSAVERDARCQADRVIDTRLPSILVEGNDRLTTSSLV